MYTCINSVFLLWSCTFFQLINSGSGPGTVMANALFHSADTGGEVTLLWHDPALTAWEPFTSYRWHLQWRPGIGKIRSEIGTPGGRQFDIRIVYRAKTSIKLLIIMVNPINLTASNLYIHVYVFCSVVRNTYICMCTNLN